MLVHETQTPWSTQKENLVPNPREFHPDPHLVDVETLIHHYFISLRHGDSFISVVGIVQYVTE
jgi:hypothetical protein